MKRTISALLALLLAVSLLTGCQKQGAAQKEENAAPAQNADTAESAEPASSAPPQDASTQAGDSGEASTAAADGMTDSYREGRQAYYELTGIWMPEAQGFEAEHEVDFDHYSIAFDSHGDRALYEAACAALREALGEPSSEEENVTSWLTEGEDGAQIHYDVFYFTEDSGDVWVFMNVYKQ